MIARTFQKYMYIMINQYVDKFIKNLPEELKNNKKPLQLDLVLDGGVFNGSYLVGALHLSLIHI